MGSVAFLSAALAGFVYGITPGPGVLALFSIGAERGRRAAAVFLTGHFAGDLVWFSLALVSIVGATSIDQTVFRMLGIASGLYLIYLGLTAMVWRARPVDPARPDSAVQSRVSGPLTYGLVFGATNPKSYAVAAAMFTALLSGQAAHLTWSALPLLVLAASLGSFVACAILIAVVGWSHFRRVYRRYEIWVRRVSGLLFIMFGGRSLADALRR